jgi:hypothetical protein
LEFIGELNGDLMVICWSVVIYWWFTAIQFCGGLMVIYWYIAI